MGTQAAIVEKTRSKRGDYVLALKENQKNLYEDVRLFLDEESEKKKLCENGKYKKNSGKGTWTDRNPGVLSNGRNPMAGTEKRMERTQKQRDGRKNNTKRWQGKKRVSVLYQ